MREIKFRGKRKDNGEWIYGNLINWGDNRYSIMPIPMHVHLAFANYEVITETVGQYTGLKDKNGKEIYDGDILLAPSWFENLICICIYQQENEVSSIQGFGLYSYDNYFQKYQNLIESDEWEEFEVIGNIHDNPELLKEEKC